MGFDRVHGVRNRHSDNEKFCNDLNGLKTPKMSEQPLKTLQYFETSKLNTPRPLSQMVEATRVAPALSLIRPRRAGVRRLRQSAGRLV